MFVLGFGAQKAGTTWLHAQLSRSRNFSCRRAKEWHYWDRWCALDTLDLPDEKSRRHHFLGDTVQSHFGEHEEYFERVRKYRKVLGVRANPFEVRADITPAYSGLPGSLYPTLRSGFEHFRINYRVIFIVRDPIDRIASAFSMYRKRQVNGKNPGAKHYLFSEDTDLREFALSWSNYFRTRYEFTAMNIKKTFPAEKVMITSLEGIAQSAEARKVASFLGVRPSERNLEQRINVGRAKPSLPPKLEQELLEVYRPTYQYFALELPAIAANWPRARSFS